MALWLSDRPLVLASGSPVRRMMLENAGIPLEVSLADIDERAIEARSDANGPGAVATLLARAKAQAVSAQFPDRLVLGADQTLALGLRRFSKPADRSAAREQLAAMRGKTHALHAAVAIVRDGETVFEHCDIAELTMRTFSDDFLERYLDSAGHMVTASVGAYQLEKIGIQLFERVEGSYFTVLGLPLLPVLDALRRQGLLKG
jgi:septum formation protein